MSEKKPLPPLMELLEDHVMVLDGAMGTMLYERGVFINTCYDALNLGSGDLVEEIHRAYVEAGSELIQTNTFGANRVKLLGYGLEEKVDLINYEGAKIARRAAGERVYVGGSVGPLGIRIEPLGPTSLQEARDHFKEQIEALADGGVDCIVLETFSHLNEIVEALHAVREVCDLPVIAQMTCREDGSTLLGTPAETFGARLHEEGADIIGVNHSDGPASMLPTIERLVKVTDRPVVAQPNAGMPKNVEGRNIYLTTPEYIAEYARRFIQAGAGLVGGCCGTTPAHIRTIKSSVRMLKPAHPRLEQPTVETGPKIYEEVPLPERSGLADRLDRGEWVICTELVPPQGPDASKTIEAARRLKEHGVFAINVPDGPRASARMGAQAMAQLIEREAGMEAVLHYTCRDRNLLAMQSDLLGLDALGIHNILIITGDPPKLGDYPDATAVYDIDSIGLTNVVTMLNRGHDAGGKDLGRPTALYHGVGCNPAAINMEEELKRFWYKVDAGANYAVTQPVFDVHQLKDFLERIADCRVPIIAGIWPLLSLRNAEFMHNEIPGVVVPDGVMQRMAAAGDAESARAEGVEIAREILETVRPMVQGAQISAPLNLYEQVIKVLGT
ncbi:MAG: bifunctional homocysteine S-methyltransferase/methylenetetrahydrofolate reductase [bacterium]